MTISFTIPVWLLWLIGVPLGAAILFFAVVGWNLVSMLSKGGIWR